jgi:hypothetical protein
MLMAQAFPHATFTGSDYHDRSIGSPASTPRTWA